MAALVVVHAVASAAPTTRPTHACIPTIESPCDAPDEVFEWRLAPTQRVRWCARRTLELVILVDNSSSTRPNIEAFRKAVTDWTNALRSTGDQPSGALSVRWGLFPSNSDPIAPPSSFTREPPVLMPLGNRYTPLARSLRAAGALPVRDADTQRVIVVMTDGGNNVDLLDDEKYASNPSGEFASLLHRQLAATVQRLEEGGGGIGPTRVLFDLVQPPPSQITALADYRHFVDEFENEPWFHAVKTPSGEVSRLLGLVKAWSHEHERRGTRGRTPATDEFSDVVLVGARDRFRCSGIVIDPRAVLTARHCLPATRVRFGDLGGFAPEISVMRTIRPPDGSDLSLLLLDKPAPSQIHKVRQVSTEVPPRGQVLHVGYGAQDLRGLSQFGQRHFVSLSAYGWGCDATRANVLGCDPRHELVLRAEPGQDTCDGDSGGGVFEEIAGIGGQCEWRLLAITSRPVANARERCGNGGIYERVDVATGWVSEVLSTLHAADDRKD